MEVTTIDIDLTDDVTDTITKIVYRKVRPLVDTISLGILEDAIEKGDFDELKSAIGEAIINSIFLDAINLAIVDHEFDEADRSR